MGVISGALALATQVMTFVNTDKARQLINDAKDIQLEILDEENKGYYSDDPKIELLKQKAKILIEAATAEWRLYAAQK